MYLLLCRNVSPGRFQRCMESLLMQDWQEFGVVLVDDASTAASCPAYQQLVLQHGVLAAFRARVRAL